LLSYVCVFYAGAFVLASKGEGWGRPYVEAMSMQLVVIATNFSGPTEYILDGENALLAKVWFIAVCFVSPGLILRNQNRWSLLIGVMGTSGRMLTRLIWHN
jgi:hypothetical protein